MLFAGEGGMKGEWCVVSIHVVERLGSGLLEVVCRRGRGVMEREYENKFNG